jgi:hypothetical protein
MLVEKSNEFGRPCWIATLDFKKAFDSITHESIWRALDDQGVHHAYISMLQKLYEGQRARVKSYQLSREFGIFRGTKQGDPISPILFNAVVEKFMRVLKQKWSTKRWGVQLGWTGESEMTNLRFADDILLIGRTLPQIRSMLSDVAREASKVGLELHAGKTKIIHNGIGYGSGVTKTRCGDMDIEVLDCESHAMYLGRALRMTDLHDEELKNRIGKAWAKFGVYRNELTDRNITLGHRLRLFDAVITPTILYGCGSWVMTTERRRRIRSTQRRMLRMITSSGRKYMDEGGRVEDYIEWVQRATRDVERLMDKYCINDWINLQRQRMWQWAGKVARATDGRWSHEVLHWELLGTRRLGRPRARWTDELLLFLQQKLGKNVEGAEWVKHARNVALWSSWQAEFSTIQS